MRAEVVKARCIETSVDDGSYVECFIPRNGGAESVSVYLLPGEWLAKYQECSYYADCGLTTSDYVVAALIRGGAVRAYEDEAVVYDVGRGYALYVFRAGGHVVLVDKQWDGWQDYVGRIGMRLEDLLDYVADRYDGEVRYKIEEALRHAKSAAV